LTCKGEARVRVYRHMNKYRNERKYKIPYNLLMLVDTPKGMVDRHNN
jgi:hypothetical protein